jgi:hypothetical protein
MHVYQVRPRKDKRGFDLISVSARSIRVRAPGRCRMRIANAIDYAKFYSRSHDAVIRVYDSAGNVIETHERAGAPAYDRRAEREGVAD